MDYFNKDGHLNDLGIALYSDAIKLGKVANLPEELVRHTSTCMDCQQTLVDFSSMMLDVDQQSADKHPYFDKKIIQSSIPAQSNPKISTPKKVEQPVATIRPLLMRIAAAAILAALVFYGYQQFTRTAPPDIVDEPSQDRPIEAKPKTEELLRKPTEELVENQPKLPNEVKEPTPKVIEDQSVNPQNSRELYAANFIPAEDYESMLGTVFRSSEFELSSPSNDAIFDQESSIPFKWKNNITVKLTILDNRDEVQLEKEISGSDFELDHKFDPGIYYWKLESIDDLLHLGKFIIE